MNDRKITRKKRKAKQSKIHKSNINALTEKVGIPRVSRQMRRKVVKGENLIFARVQLYREDNEVSFLI